MSDWAGNKDQKWFNSIRENIWKYAILRSEWIQLEKILLNQFLKKCNFSVLI